MRYLSLAEVLFLYERLITRPGGGAGLRDLGALESALAQPRATFDAVDLYPSVVEKGAALAYSLVGNHPFVDGNKRVGHAALETFLVLNGFALTADVDEAEHVFLALAAGTLTRTTLQDWIGQHYAPFHF